MFTADDHTFVVCAYKENPFIGATIESLQNQTQKSKIILSTSTPNSYLKQICEYYSIQMVVNSNPQGAGSDWNYGFDAAETSLVTMAHQDDLYRQEFLANMLSAINQYPAKEVQLAFSDYYELRNGEEVDRNLILRVKRLMNAGFSNRLLNGRVWFKRRVLAFGDSICCPAVTLVKDTIGSSPFDTKYINSCDYKTWVDLASIRGRFVYVPKKLVGHRIYQESATSKNLGENIRKGEDLEILSSLWPRPVAACVNRVYAISEKSNNL